MIGLELGIQDIFRIVVMKVDSHMSTAYIALGANLSNPKQSFIKALDAIAALGIPIENVSGLWKSPSWPPGLGHPDYLNAVAKISFAGKPMELLDILNQIETEFGRVRDERNAPRPMDLDIIDFDGIEMCHDRLTLPHPRMETRGFVLLPLQQVASDWIRPGTGDSIESLIAKLPLSDIAPMDYCGKFYSILS